MIRNRRSLETIPSDVDPPDQILKLKMNTNICTILIETKLQQQQDQLNQEIEKEKTTKENKYPDLQNNCPPL